MPVLSDIQSHPLKTLLPTRLDSHSFLNSLPQKVFRQPTLTFSIAGISADKTINSSTGRALSQRQSLPSSTTRR